MSHLDDGLIQELLDGEVPSNDLPPIQAHLASCAACRARLEEARDFATASDEMIGWLDETEVTAPVAPIAATDIAPRRTVASWPRNVAWAASLLLAVGLGYTARGGLVPAPASTPVAPALEATAAVQSDPVPAPTGNTAPEAAREMDAPAAQAEPVLRAPTPATPPTRDAVAGAGTRTDAAEERQRVENIAVPAERAVGARRELADESALARRALAPAPTAAGAAASLQAREQSAAKALGEAEQRVDSIGMPRGTLFEITGLTPTRTTLVGDEVRIVYAQSAGEVTLVQRRVGAQVAWRLEAPVGFPAAVLRELTARVK